MSLTILLEIGHDASLKSKISPEGFTHDWEVFVRGQNNADIHYYVDKVIFNLHETFPNPKRVVKQPPFSLRTSGYAGFKLPIEIYLKNNQEPKRIKFNYELYLQPNGPAIHIVQKEKYTFFNPSEEFRIKLLKGGAVEGSGKEENSIGKIAEEKNYQMTSKPKLGGLDTVKKHKMKFDEPKTTDFENLFGPPIKKNSKIPEPPKPKEPPPIKSQNSDKSSDKDKTKSNKSMHKDKEKSKEKSSDNSDKKNKEDKKKSKDEKNKDRSKEKSSRKDKDREKSPQTRPRSASPKRSPKRESSVPPIQKITSSNGSTSTKEKDDRRDREKDKKEDKKAKKEKRDHKEGKHKDKEKDKEHKEHKSKSSKERDSTSGNKLKETSPLAIVPNSSQNANKTDKKPKEKEQVREQQPKEEKLERIEKEKSEKPRQGSEDKDKKDRQNKHKHKKKDRKEKKEEKHSKKEEKKGEKQSNNAKETISAPDKNNLFGSPKNDSPPTPKVSSLNNKIETNSLFTRDDDSSNDSVKISSREASPAPAPRMQSKSPSPPPPPPVSDPAKRPEPDKKKDPSLKKKDKKEKKKEKKFDKDYEKRRKRKSDSTTVDVEPTEKAAKIDEENESDEESKVSSTEDATNMAQPKSECDMDMLRDLQHKIMSLKDTADLQKIVQLIAETGQYEISAHTFDFDLCLLDKSTVKQLQNFFSTIS